MSTKRLYLHLGLHKTGSSSFQKTCEANREILANEQIHYPIFQASWNGSTRKVTNHSIPLCSLLGTDPARYHINTRWGVTNHQDLNLQYREQLETTLDSHSKVILSGEGISLLATEGLARLNEIAKGYGFKIIPFAVVRSPLQFFASSTQQQIKGGHYKSFVGLGELSPPSLPPQPQLEHYASRIERLQDFFDKDITFIPFQAACSHPSGPSGYLLETLIKLPEESANKITHRRYNSSHSNIWTRVQNQLNKINPQLLQGKINPAHTRAKSRLNKIGDKFLFTLEEYNLLAESIKNCEDRIANLLGDKFIDDSKDFSETISHDQIIALLGKIHSRKQNR